MKALRRLLIVVVAITVLTVGMLGCSAGYIARAALEEGQILLARRDIQDVVDDPASSNDERAKLALVLQARQFAIGMGLDPGHSFTKYSKIDKDVLAWIVVASRRDSFMLHTWWFPIVGRVPYKGFFEMEDAQAEVANLERGGYECSIRGTEAFSTLGWFNDPILSTTLRHEPGRIVNTVIHESVHSTVWIKNNVAFNESLANFIGTEGAVAFFQEHLKGCDESNCAERGKLLISSEAGRALQYELSDLIDSLSTALEGLYQRPDLSAEEKIERRGPIFEAALGTFRARYPSVQILQHINNAEIIQLKLYLSHLDTFRRLFERVERRWEPFLAKIKEIQESLSKNSAQDPFELLRLAAEGDVAP